MVVSGPLTRSRCRIPRSRRHARRHSTGTSLPSAKPYLSHKPVLKHVLWRLDDDVLSSYIPGTGHTAPRPGLLHKHTRLTACRMRVAFIRPHGGLLQGSRPWCCISCSRDICRLDGGKISATGMCASASVAWSRVCNGAAGLSSTKLQVASKAHFYRFFPLPK